MSWQRQRCHPLMTQFSQRKMATLLSGDLCVPLDEYSQFSTVCVWLTFLRCFERIGHMLRGFIEWFVRVEMIRFVVAFLLCLLFSLLQFFVPNEFFLSPLYGVLQIALYVVLFFIILLSYHRYKSNENLKILHSDMEKIKASSPPVEKTQNSI